MLHVLRYKIQNLDNFEILHPRYSPDLVPTDFYLFGSMAPFLRGKQFNSEDVKTGIIKFAVFQAAA